MHKLSLRALSARGRPVSLPEETATPGRAGVLERLLANRLVVGVVLSLVLALAAALRLTGLNWDQNQHLNPDERFLTMVETSMRWPAGLGEYLDEARSPLNPRNVGIKFFAYGTLPTTMVKGVSLALGQGGYEQVFLVGRALSALFDLGSVLLLFLLARKLYRDNRIALLAALLYSAAALAIQYAHFFTVDSFTVFFVMLALYGLARVQQQGGIWNYALVGAGLGMALASKLSVFTLAAVVVVVGAYRVWRAWELSRYGRRVAVSAEQTFVRLVVVGLVAFVVFRVAQPDAFRGPGLLSITPSERWLANLDEARRTVGGDVDTPPGHQWTDRAPLWFPWENMVLWGMGLPLGLAAWAGWAVAGWRLARRREWAHLVPVTWVAVLFLHQGTQWVKSMRYFLPIYPVLALLAAWLLVWLWDRARDGQIVWKGRALVSWTPARAVTLLGVVVAGTLLWGLAFTGIYTRPHSRIEASRWIYDNVPKGAALANEHWDDGLPLRLDGKDPFPKIYEGVPMLWYDGDTPEKLTKALGWLDQADYIILSSNRLYGSIPRLPVRYPMTIRYYGSLFDGSLGFERVAEFTSYPQLAGISIPDQGAEEAFTVYDHPRVQIFKKTPAYSQEHALSILSDVDWEAIMPLTPRQATRAPTGLRLPADDWTVYRWAGTWSELFKRGDLANSLPVPVWALVLELLGLIAAPYLFVAARSLPDRGYALARPLGLLLCGWLAWMLASLHVLEFSRGTILLAFGVAAIGALALVWANRAEMWSFVRGHRRLLLWEEGLFWAFFALFVAVRFANPDLWHPTLGGEKPMDFAFLNATVKSPYFPPYDPWFAGGYINYYHFGFVLVGMLMKVTGIVPAVAYNLAVPTLFAMAVLGAFGVALALVSKERQEKVGPREVRFGLLGALFVAVTGNLGELRLVLDGLSAASTSSVGSGVPGLGYLTRVASGLHNVLLAGTSLPFHVEWWYWNPTRVIAHPAGEAGPITEFPWFTFLFADLHAHATALPLALVALGLSVAVVRGVVGRGQGEGEGGYAEDKGGHEVGKGGHIGPKGGHIGPPLLALWALVIGALWPTNTWDFPTYSVIALAALLLGEWGRAGRLTLGGAWRAGRRWAVVLVAGYVLYLPFHKWYGQGYGSFELWLGSRTSLADYLTIHGFFLFVIASALLADLWFGHGHNGVVRRMRLVARNWYRPRRLSRLHRALVRPGPLYRAGFAAVRWVGLLAVALVALGYAAPGVIVVLLTLTALLGLRRRPDPLWQMALALTGVGLALTLLVEFVVLKGDIGRANTVFKFYFQVWVLFGVAAALGVARVWEQLPRLTPGWRRTWRLGFVALFGATLLYPALATPARINDRFSSAAGPTLDGASFMEQAVYRDQDREIATTWDKAAIEWLQNNVSGSPVIAEANTYPTLYGWGNRYAMFTGLPAIVGWDWHERQQRALVSGDVVTRRIEDVKQLYDTTDLEEALKILHRYKVSYVIVGQLERAYYTADGIAKFEQMKGKSLDLAYENPQVRIYKVTR